ncbi:hypothetical protein O181_086458 [Austropuccinia psidii MF-1]|uniref:Uncharacterized protein n=1 Tax=Austropuccinia psidii MF-1 TaxID=1389203 RepID=A0A9Q3IM84_9BASI|nr:hypothetical protein [Austropuccinia psidii MF-1]
MLPLHLRNLGFQRNQPEDREGLSRTRRPGSGHLGHSAGWQDTEGNHNHPAIHFPIQQEPQSRGLARYGSSSSAPPTPQRFISMEHGQQEVQPVIRLGRTWSKFQKICVKEIDFIDLMEKERIKGQKQDHLQPEEERVIPTDPEAVGFGERSAQEPEVALNNSLISSPIYRNITPTQIEHNVVTPENNLNSDALSLQMSQYAETTQKRFSELEASHEMMKILTASMEKMFKTFKQDMLN